MRARAAVDGHGVAEMAQINAVTTRDGGKVTMRIGIHTGAFRRESSARVSSATTSGARVVRGLSACRRARAGQRLHRRHSMASEGGGRHSRVGGHGAAERVDHELVNWKEVAVKGR